MFVHDEYTHSAEAEDLDLETELLTCMSSPTSIRKMKSKNKRRFSDEQIKSLESIFETESRLEPRKKLQLARELGLEPRQVAIWFQNKRARWKSKQLQRDYSILQANYNNLATRFEVLKKEKQALLTQLQKLNDRIIEKSQPENECSWKFHAGKDSNNESENGDNTVKLEDDHHQEKPGLSVERSISEHGVGGLSEDDSSKRAEYFGLEDEIDLMNSLASPDDWGNFESDGPLLDQTNGGYQWWDFWT